MRRRGPRRPQGTVPPRWRGHARPDTRSRQLRPLVRCGTRRGRPPLPDDVGRHHDLPGLARRVRRAGARGHGGDRFLPPAAGHGPAPGRPHGVGVHPAQPRPLQPGGPGPDQDRRHRRAADCPLLRGPRPGAVEPGRAGPAPAARAGGHAPDAGPRAAGAAQPPEVRPPPPAARRCWPSSRRRSWRRSRPSSRGSTGTSPSWRRPRRRWGHSCGS